MTYVIRAAVCFSFFGNYPIPHSKKRGSMISHFFKLVAVATVVSTLVGAIEYTKEALADQVLNLPGAEGLVVPFNQFSGYIHLNGTKSGTQTKHMHYWLVESMSDPASSPVAFWTNGGPGCSGLLGALTEQGPFRPKQDLSLELNPYAWNANVNMVFIEQPCG